VRSLLDVYRALFFFDLGETMEPEVMYDAAPQKLKVILGRRESEKTWVPLRDPYCFPSHSWPRLRLDPASESWPDSIEGFLELRGPILETFGRAASAIFRSPWGHFSLIERTERARDTHDPVSRCRETDNCPRAHHPYSRNGLRRNHGKLIRLRWPPELESPKLSAEAPEEEPDACGSSAVAVALGSASLLELPLQLFGLLTLPFGVALRPAEIEHVLVRFRRDGFRRWYQLLADGALYRRRQASGCVVLGHCDLRLWLCHWIGVKSDSREPD
jgi:hypothetical protein